MSKRGIDAPLAEQMDRLKRSMHSRDQRRDQDREKRQVGKAADDPYAQSSVSRPSKGGVNLGPGAAAQAAVLNAAALAGPVVIRCELCQTDFRNEAMLRQHEEGPAHKKAVAREKAEREREAWATNPSAAANALQAAAWLNGGVTTRMEPNYIAPARNKGASKLTAPKPAAKAPAKSQGPSHAELIAQARKVNEPISINGWIPPSLSLPSRREGAPQLSEAEAHTASAAASSEERAPAGTQTPDGDNAEDATESGKRAYALGDVTTPKGIAHLQTSLPSYSSSSGEESKEDKSEDDAAQPQPQFISFF